MRTRFLAAPVAVVMLGGAGWLSLAAASPDADYRTATAVVSDVDQTLDLTGTVSPTGRVDLAFGTDGEIAQVRVAVGDRVSADQVIAVLDRSELRAELKAAQADLAAAKARLEADQEAQAKAVAETVRAPSASQAAGAGSGTKSGQANQTGSSGGKEPDGQTTGTGRTGNTEPGGQTSEGDPGSAALEAALGDLQTQQEAITTAQSEASGAIATAEAALVTQQEVCQQADATDAPSDDGANNDGADNDGGATQGSSSGEAEEPTEDSRTDGDAGVSQECKQALATVQSAQAAVADAQSTLQGALEALTDTLETAVQAVDAGDQQQNEPQPAEPQRAEPQQQQQQQQQPETPQQEPEQGPSPAPSAAAPGDPGADTTGTVTAASLARDQAAIDQAVVDVRAAEEALAAAVVRAPAAGQVVSLSVAEGDDVTAGSATAVVVGEGLTAVDVEVSASQAAQLETGQEGAVTPAGAEKAFPGTVSQIRNTPIEEEESAETGTFPRGASSATKYPVTVTLDRTDLTLASGMPADVEITVGQATDTLTVPTSAVSNGAVTVLEHGETSSVRVTTGLVADVRTEIIEGLEDGTEVVLADLGAELPSGGSQTGGTGGFGGSGGRFGGGRRGGAPGFGG